MRGTFTKLLLSACLSLSAAQAARAQGSGTTTRASRSPAEVARGFYAWYLGRLNKDDWNPLKRRREALRFLTPEFHRKAPSITLRWGVNIFVCAQDWMQSWEREFRVAPAAARGEKAAAVVTLPVRGGEDIRVKVSLRRAAGAWKIDATECLPSPEESR